MVSILRRVKDGRHSLQGLDFVGAEWDRKDRRVVHADGRCLRKNPTHRGKYQTVSYGLTQDLEPDELDEDLDDWSYA